MGEEPRRGDNMTGEQNSPDGGYRYWQQYRTVLAGSRICLAIMFNPTGKNRMPGEYGRTIRTCLRFAEQYECAVLRTCNLFARKDYPDGENCALLPDPPDPVEIRRENDGHIAAEIAKADIILCAWGDVGSKRTTEARAREVLALLAEGDTDGKLYALGINKSGQPRHPARAPVEAVRVRIAGGKLERAR